MTPSPEHPRDRRAPESCRDVVRLVTDYLDGALDRDEGLAFEEHVAACRPCRAHLTQMRRTLEVAGRIAEDELGAEAEQTLVEMFREWRRGAR